MARKTVGVVDQVIKGSIPLWKKEKFLWLQDLREIVQITSVKLEVSLTPEEERECLVKFKEVLPSVGYNTIGLKGEEVGFFKLP